MKTTWIRVLSDRHVLRIRASREADIVGTVTNGDLLWLARREQGLGGVWLHVRRPDGTHGWAEPGLKGSYVATRHATGRDVEIRTEPDANAPVVRTLRAGASVLVLGNRDAGIGRWSYVSMPTGQGGWIPGTTPVTFLGGSLSEAIAGGFLILLGVAFVFSLAGSGLFSNFPFALIGIGIAWVAHGWRERVEASALRLPPLTSDSRLPPSRIRPPRADSATPIVPRRSAFAKRERGEYEGLDHPLPRWHREPQLYVTLVLLAFGTFELASGLARRADALAWEVSPSSISCAQLEADGPRGARRLVLTDFLICDAQSPADSVAPERRADSGSSEKRYWFAVVAYDGKYARSFRRRWNAGSHVPMRPPTPVSVLVCPPRPVAHLPTLEWTMALHSAADESRPAKPIEVEVVTDRSTLSSHDESRLREEFPGVDAARCRLLKAPERHASSGEFLVVAWLGVAAIVAGMLSAFLLLRRRWRHRAQAEA